MGGREREGGREGGREVGERENNDTNPLVMVSTLCFQLKCVQLSHLEDVRQREEEIEAQYAGQMAYLKLHHKELIEDMQTKHNSEVCVCVNVWGGGGEGEIQKNLL